MDEIINKVAQSGLIEFNLENFYDNSERVVVDIKNYLTSFPIGDGLGYILKEKTFRELCNHIDIEQFENKNVAIYCSVDAIVPTWAYMLLGMIISTKAKKVIFGNLEMLENILFSEALNKVNINDYTDAKVIIKGCSKHNVPTNAYVQIANLLKPIAKSIMYGEPCSTVPLFKKAK
jgi:hypothetical protein